MAPVLVESHILTAEEYIRLSDLLSPNTVEGAILALEQKNLVAFSRSVSRFPKVAVPVRLPQSNGQGLAEKTIPKDDAFKLIAATLAVLGQGLQL